MGVWWRQHFDKAGLLLFLKKERENQKRDKPDDSGEASVLALEQLLISVYKIFEDLWAALCYKRQIASPNKAACLHASSVTAVFS
ncbi:hypothetical protein [Paenibacillus lutrae]|uniref:Uncharacterized protein n=1 Tax=Paenibacillus lutrae TaxID=2078573 RepID=A0A7X3FEJ4_9BACL|nr:hypothetical protein [Paenibacillus lutrae]MVO98256.1 hypothetical protein [Paenibacillus lutrae]